MTDIDTMPAGDEMDFYVKHEVMGIGPGFRKGLGGLQYNNKPYSTDIAAAWEVVEKLDLKIFLIELMKCRADGNENDREEWQLTLSIYPDYQERYYSCADTVPLAICRAALLAVRANCQAS